MSFEEFAKFFNLAVGHGSLLPELEDASKQANSKPRKKPKRHTEM